MLALIPRTKRYVFPATQTLSIKQLMDWTNSTWIGTITLRAGRANVEDIGWSDANLSQGGYLGAAEAATLDFGPGQTLARHFFISGHINDVVYITIGLNYTSFTQMGGGQ